MAKRGKSTRSARSASSPAKAAPAPAEVEIVEEKAGMGWEGGVAIVTTILILVAYLFVDKASGAYGAGLFFK